MNVSYVVELIGWCVIGIGFLALAITAAGRYMDRHPSPVEHIAEDRLAHVKEWAHGQQETTTADLEQLYRLPSR